VSLEKPYRLERWFLWSNGDLRKWSNDYETEKDARSAMDFMKDFTETTRIRLSFRRTPRNCTVLSVWSR